MPQPWGGQTPDSPTPESTGLRLADLLPYLAAAGAGVATAYAPRTVGPAVQAGLGTFTALNAQRQHERRLADELAQEKQNKERFTQNFGQLLDYYSPNRTVENPGVPYLPPADMPPEQAGPARQWLKDQGFPEHAALDPANKAFLAGLAPLNPALAMSRLDAALTKERRPSLAEAQTLSLKSGQSVKATTSEGYAYEAKGDQDVHDAEKTLIDLAQKGVTTGSVVDAAKGILASKNAKTPFSVMNDLVSKGITSGQQYENAKASFLREHPGQQPPSAQLSWDKAGNPVAFDPKTRTVGPVTMTGGAGAPVRNAPTTDEANAIEVAAQSIAKGDLSPIRHITGFKGMQRLVLFARVKELDPKFNTAELERKIKMEEDFTVGKDGKQLQSFGTFLEHAGDASDAIGSIYQSGIPAVGKSLNYWRKNFSGSPDYQRLITALVPVRNEFAIFMSAGYAPHEADLRKMDVVLSDDSSPAQIRSALMQMGKTTQARFTQMNHRYRRLMGKDFPDPFSSEAIDGAAKIGLKLGGGQAKTATTAPAGGVPAPVQPGQRPPLSSFER